MNDPQPKGILAKSSTVISLLADTGPLTPAEVAERTGTPRASVYRLLDALTAADLTELLPSGHYRLGLRWLRLADAASPALTEWVGASAALDELAEVTGQTTFLSIPRSQEAVCIKWAPGSAIGVLILRPGRSLPLHAGAAGRLCLAYQDNPDIFLSKAPFTRFTANTLTSEAELRDDIAATRSRGYSVSDEDVTEGIGALGVPVWETPGRLGAALSLAGPAIDIRNQQEDLIDELQRAARRLITSGTQPLINESIDHPLSAAKRT